MELWAYGACLVSTGCWEMRKTAEPCQKDCFTSLPTCLGMWCKQSRRNLGPTPNFSNLSLNFWIFDYSKFKTGPQLLSLVHVNRFAGWLCLERDSWRSESTLILRREEREKPWKGRPFGSPISTTQLTLGMPLHPKMETWDRQVVIVIASSLGEIHILSNSSLTSLLSSQKNGGPQRPQDKWLKVSSRKFVCVTWLKVSILMCHWPRVGYGAAEETN